MGAGLFYADGEADGRTDRRTDMTNLWVAFRSYAKAPKDGVTENYVRNAYRINWCYDVRVLKVFVWIDSSIENE